MKKSKDEIRGAVKKHYGEAVKHRSGCGCGPSDIKVDGVIAERIAQAHGYTNDDLGSLPEGVASFGCGNPLTFAQVKEGDVVLDLGSGPGLDLILAARKVGDRGKVIGLDMTPEMVETCRTNLQKANATNAEVRQGEMESMPVADSEVDWIISNCVINLSPEKEKVFAEAYRVLKPGGQMMISDIVTVNLPEDVRNDMRAWVGCIAGAVEEDEFIELAKNAGFEEVRIVARQSYSTSALQDFASSDCGCGCYPDDHCEGQAVAGDWAGKVASVRLYARKPR
ncbi:MAG: arsenite methyltransferase [Candidatus Zixiibacteriota bacterium]|nr:MAG: arsenite methyltransferase [candidate division Zixibacteria bacterium]